MRQALRGFRRTPVFTTVAIASLALGIGANTGIFSFVNAILLKRLPVPEPHRLVTFGDARRGSGVVWSMGTIEDLAQRASAFDGVFGWFAKPFNFSTGQTAHWVAGELVTGQYYGTFQVKPALGELLTDARVRDAAANPVCVLSYDFWRSEFGGDPRVLGRAVFLQGRPYRVLGVSARGFYGADMQRHFDVAAPASRVGDFMPSFGPARLDWTTHLSWLAPMARLKPGITLVEAEHLTEPLLQPDGNKAGQSPASPFKLRLADGSQGLNTMGGSFGRPVLVLMAIVVLVLLVACANLANLLLARAQGRAKELAVRVSLGASRSRLIRQFLMESLLLAAGGGLAGIGMSLWMTRTLLSFLNAGRSAVYALRITPDARVLAFSLLLSFVTALVLGLVPAFQATRPSLLPGLHGSTGSPSRSTLLRRSLVVTQIALSLVIVFAAGLLTRTLGALQTVNLGFQADRAIALNVDPAAAGYSASESSGLLDELLSRARALPSVRAASLALSTPNGSMGLSMSVDVPGYTPKGIRDNLAYMNFISPSYFDTLGQSLLRGRDFDEHDGRNAPRVAIVNRKFVHHYFEGRDPLGLKIRQGGGDIEIVGVVSDSRDFGIRRGPEETVYLPERQTQTSGLTLLVRTDDQPQRLIPSLLALVRMVDSRLTVFSVHTLDVDVDAGLSTERILGYLSTLFAALAASLAGIGLYGVLAYFVTGRTREIGLRLAVGAQRRSVASLFARESLALVLAGLVLGTLAALATARSLQSLLFGVAATDPLTFFLSLQLLAVIALAATAIPLWRAVRVNPSVALRHE